MPDNRASDIIVATFYRFTRFEDPEALRGPLASACAAAGAKGTIILAREGVNGTIAASRTGVDAALARLRPLPGCESLAARTSAAAAPPFRRLDVRVRPEIVTLGDPAADPSRRAGVHVAPADWNALIRAPDVAVIDARNAYEVAVGSFAGAVDPGTASFRDFPKWWAANAARFAGKRIAMFCTGGIRCEKASSHLLGQGVAHVHQLEGGILAYLAAPPAETLWRGGCFVFDARVTVGPGLATGDHRLCHACGGAVSRAGQAHPSFEPGVSCPACIDAYGPADRARFRMRQRQIALAAARQPAADASGRLDR